MHNISTLKDQLNTKTLNFVLLSFATGGIYLLMWLYKNQSVITDTTRNPFSNNLYIIWIAVCFGLSSQLQPYIGIGAGEYSDNNSSDGIAILILLLSLAGNVLCIVWAFKAKSALQHYALMEFKFELKMNAFYTFLFSVFYITYCINAMPEALQKHNIIHGSRPLSEERHAE